MNKLTIILAATIMAFSMAAIAEPPESPGKSGEVGKPESPGNQPSAVMHQEWVIVIESEQSHDGYSICPGAYSMLAPISGPDQSEGQRPVDPNNDEFYGAFGQWNETETTCNPVRGGCAGQLSEESFTSNLVEGEADCGNGENGEPE